MRIVIGIVIGLIVALGASAPFIMDSGIVKKWQGGPKEDRGMGVRLTAAETGDLVRTISAPGSIEPRTLVEISSQVSAEVLALPFREGETVQAGDVVVRLDPQDLEARLASAQAALRGEQARLKGSDANLINARLNYERLRSLVETGDATKAELDAAEAQYLGAQASKEGIEHSIEQARANIDQVQTDIENTIITSPMDGVITVLNAEVGETVIVGTTNNAGSVIMEIADLSEMLLKAQVDEQSIAPVEPGQDATVYVNAYPKEEFHGTVRRVGLKRQVGTDGTGTFDVEILLNLDEGQTLLSGLTASVDVAVEKFFDVVKVPSQAVLDRRTEDLSDDLKANELVDIEETFTRLVFLLEDGKAVARPVIVGPSDLTHTVIVAGLEPGDRVISGPFRALVGLHAGQKVYDEEAAFEKPGDGEDAEGNVEAASASKEDAAADSEAEEASADADQSESSEDASASDSSETDTNESGTSEADDSGTDEGASS